jgi:protein SCO1/2
MMAALVCAFALEAHAGDAQGSLYELALGLTDQSGRARPLDLYRGEVTLITMFYSSCPMACPLLIDALRATEHALALEERARVRVLMVSIDPERDTPERLARLARERRVDLSRWTLARADEQDVRLLAAALDIRYRRLPDGEYNHTSAITLLDRDGVIRARRSVLGGADAEFVDKVRAALR